MQRDYLETVKQLPGVISEKFWEEEISFVLNGDRDVQIKYLGGSPEYFKRLIKESANPHLQQMLLIVAINNSVKHFQFSEAINHIEEKKHIEQIINYTELVRTFCAKDSYNIQLFSEFFTSLCRSKLRITPELIGFTNSLPFLRLYNSIKYLVEDFLPKNITYDMLRSEKRFECGFLEEYFQLAETFLKEEGEIFTSSLQLLLKYRYNLYLSDEIIDKIQRDVRTLESFIVDYKTHPNIYETLIIHILYRYENSFDREGFMTLLAEFDINKDNINYLIQESEKLKLNKLKESVLESKAIVNLVISEFQAN